VFSDIASVSGISTRPVLGLHFLAWWIVDEGKVMRSGGGIEDDIVVRSRILNQC
jgi:hypothetical protein